MANSIFLNIRLNKNKCKLSIFTILSAINDF